MKKIALFTGVFFLALIANSPTASAHQPEYIDTETNIHIPDPYTSRAYYGELTGAPAVYIVSSSQNFSLYLNILSPYLPSASRDFTASITNASGTVIAILSAPASEWQEWYEEFAGDMYWKGPEFRQIVPAGTYTISVSNPRNTGKYVIAPGEAEVFTLGGTPATIHQIYLIKTHFFEKSWYSVFQGIIGKILLGIIGIFMVLVISIAFFLLRRTQKI